MGAGCGRGSPPPAVRVREYYLRKILENSDAKSCILVTTCSEMSCLLKTTAKKLGDQCIVSPPTQKLGDQSPPVPTVVAPMSQSITCAYDAADCTNRYSAAHKWTCDRCAHACREPAVSTEGLGGRRGWGRGRAQGNAVYTHTCNRTILASRGNNFRGSCCRVANHAIMQ